MAKIVQ